MSAKLAMVCGGQVFAVKKEEIGDLAKALRELGRIERTLFMIEWYSSPALRGGSVCLNSFGRFAKWISASIMPPPSLVSAR